MKKRIFRIIVQVVGWAAVAGLLVPLLFIHSSVYQKHPVDTPRGAVFWFVFTTISFGLAWVIVFLLRGKRKNITAPMKADRVRTFLFHLPYPVFLAPLILLQLLNARWFLHFCDLPSSGFLRLILDIVAVGSFISMLSTFYLVLFSIVTVFLAVIATACKKSEPWFLGFCLAYFVSVLFVLLVAMRFLIGITGGA